MLRVRAAKCSHSTPFQPTHYFLFFMTSPLSHHLGLVMRGHAAFSNYLLNSALLTVLPFVFAPHSQRTEITVTLFCGAVGGRRSTTTRVLWTSFRSPLRGAQKRSALSLREVVARRLSPRGLIKRSRGGRRPANGSVATDRFRAWGNAPRVPSALLFRPSEALAVLGDLGIPASGAALS